MGFSSTVQFSCFTMWTGEIMLTDSCCSTPQIPFKNQPLQVSQQPCVLLYRYFMQNKRNCEEKTLAKKNNNNSNNHEIEVLHEKNKILVGLFLFCFSFSFSECTLIFLSLRLGKAC